MFPCRYRLDDMIRLLRGRKKFLNPPTRSWREISHVAIRSGGVMIKQGTAPQASDGGGWWTKQRASQHGGGRASHQNPRASCWGRIHDVGNEWDETKSGNERVTAVMKVGLVRQRCSGNGSTESIALQRRYRAEYTIGNPPSGQYTQYIGVEQALLKGSRIGFARHPCLV